MRTALIACAALAASAFSAAPAMAGEVPQVLVFSKTTGWRHDSIEPAVAALQAMGEREGWEIEASEDPAVLSAGLEGYDALILLSSTTNGADADSEWMDEAARDALQAHLRGGGAVVGVHAAADSHYHWPWYRQMIGAAFEMHPPGTPEGALTVVDADHPATRDLPTEFTRTDEWYWFSDFDADAVRLLITLDAGSIGEEGGDVPMAWSHEFEGGRVFYTAMGHTAESFEEPLFLDHLRGGISWALGEAD
ncbi:ThuA domain-containing protein [Glycocaulis profundi]|nr:ThuA domain-containing protein [Glycocaulis profundi]